MHRLVALVAFALSGWLPVGWGAALPPERGISLDFGWLSPPAISPEGAWGDVVQTNGHIRLVSRPGMAGPSFTWGLRYPVDMQSYPVMVLRYRAIRIGSASEPVIALEMAKGNPVPVAYARELRQGGAIQEFRKDLRPVTAGSEIERVRFMLPPAVARLDVLELRFEPAGEVVQPTAPLKRNMDVLVVDERDRPIDGATVLAGALERANWVAAGQSDVGGRVSLVVALPGAGDQKVDDQAAEGQAADDQAAGMPEAVQPIEVAVMAPGFEPQYIQAISFRPNEVIGVRLMSDGASPNWMGDQATDDQPTAFGIGRRVLRFKPNPTPSASGVKGPGGVGVSSVSTFRVLSVPTHEIVPITTPGGYVPRVPRRRR